LPPTPQLLALRTSASTACLSEANSVSLWLALFGALVFGIFGFRCSLCGRFERALSHDTHSFSRAFLVVSAAQIYASDGHDYDACPDQSIFSDHVGPHSDDVTSDQCQQQCCRGGSHHAEDKIDVVIALRCKGISTGR
jgi:hypothetical protein